MRIILTELGGELMKALSDEHDSTQKMKQEEEKLLKSHKNQMNNHLPRRKHQTHYGSPFQEPSPKKNQSLRHRGDFISKLEMDQTTISVEDLTTAKQIDVRQRKLNIPKNVTEKYNTISKDNVILPNVNNLFPKGETRKNTEIGTEFTSMPAKTHRQKQSIKQILNESSYRNLKNQLVKEKVMRDKLTRVDENKFRTTYEEKNFLQKLDETLQKKINPDRINLIKYLNTKDDVSEVLVKRVAEYDEEKINRVNKICQIVFHNKESDKLFKEIIKERLIAQNNRDKVDYKKKIETMGRNVNGIESILKNYEKRVEDKERYRDLHNDMIKNYWNRYKTDQMQRKGNKRIGKSASKMDYSVNQLGEINASKIIYTDSTDV
jgi:hypothetical protein